MNLRGRCVVLVVLASVVILLPPLLCSTYRFSSYVLSQHTPLYLPPNIFILRNSIRVELVTMFRTMHMGLTRANLIYFLTAGSLLGWKRHHKSMIPWDDDIDVGVIFPVQPNAWRVFKTYVESYGFTIVAFRGWYKLISTRIPLCDRLAISIDIFPYSRFKQSNRLSQTSRIARRLWPRENFEIGNVFPLKKTMFEGAPTFVPNSPHKVLVQSYGHDYIKVAFVNKIHGPLPYAIVHTNAFQTFPCKLTL